MMIAQTRYLSPLSALALFALLISCNSENSSETTYEQPNVIVIMADDLGYETIGVNGGSSYQTPEIDRLASNGMRFEHCYAQPLCTPSRVQLMTGVYNVRNYVRFGLLEQSQTTFGHLFQKAGYATCIVGKWQLGKDPASPQHAGFGSYCLWQVSEGRVDTTGRDTRFSKPVLEVNGKVNSYSDTDYGPKIVSQFGLDFIQQSHDKEQPFLLYYPMILTHCPFSPTPNSPEWNQGDTTTMSYKGEVRYFADMVFQMDQIVGEISDKLEELGIQNNTILIFTGDNGTDVPVISMINGREIAGAKGKSTDAGTRVPLIIQWPDVIKANSANLDLIDFSDFLPTICEAAKIDIETLDLDGQSFLPQLRGEKGNPRDWIYSWYSRSGEVGNARVFVRNHRYKLYDSGEFYEIPIDYHEQNPLDIKTMNEDTQKVYKQFSEVLEHYRERRLDKIQISDN